MKTCRDPGCTRPASGYSTHCIHHKTRARRHGHPQQEGIRKSELEPHLKTVRRRMQKNPEARVWRKIEERWAALVDACRAEIASAERGVPYQADAMRASRELIKVAESTAPQEVVFTVMAMFLLAEDDPRRFRSDNAFWVQLSRRVRHLTDMNVGAYWDQTSGKCKRVYRDLPPKVSLICGKLLAEAIGPAGLYLAGLEKREAEAKRQEQAELYEALEDLK